MAHKNEHLYVEKRLKPGWYMYWRHQTYRIIPSDRSDPLTLDAQNTTTSEVRPFSFTELWRSDSDDEEGPIFAPTEEQLRREIDTRHPIPEIAPTTGIPAKLLTKANDILSVVEQVKNLVLVAQEKLEKERKQQEQNGEPTRKATNTDILRAACALLQPKSIKLSTFYKYQYRINKHHGDRSAIAASC
jgi:hypothetical protein